MSTFMLVYFLLIHYLADFALQTDQQAKMKSTSDAALSNHIWVYCLVWLIATLPLFGWWAFLFAMITFPCHALTDYFSSRIGKKYWDKGDLHNGFVIMGMDQILHYIQLYLTYKVIVWDMTTKTGTMPFLDVFSQ